MNAEGVCAKVSGGLKPQAEDLVRIWTYAGYGAGDIDQKIARLLKACQATVDGFLSSENEAVNQLNAEVEAQRQEVAKCCGVLHIPPYFPPHGLNTCQLLQNLKDKKVELEEEKVSRKAEYRRLCCEIITSSLQLGHSEDSIRSKLLPSQDVPSKEDLSRLQATADENNAVLGPLVSQLNALQADIRRIATEIAYVPQTEREKVLLKLEENGQDSAATDGLVNGNQGDVFDVEEQIKLITAMLKGAQPNEADLEELKALRLSLVKEKARIVGTCEELKSYLSSMWKRLEKPQQECDELLKTCEAFTPKSLQILKDEADACRQERLQRIKTYLPAVKAELLDLARTCYLDQQEIASLAKLETSEGSVLLNHIEYRIEELKLLFAQNRRVYEAIGAFQRAFHDLQQVEARLKDPAILSNRGGILLKTEKEKKRLVKEVEKLEKEAAAAVAEYESTKGHPFLLSDGKTFAQAVEEQRSAVVGTPSRSARSSTSSAYGRRPNSGGIAASQPC